MIPVWRRVVPAEKSGDIFFTNDFFVIGLDCALVDRSGKGEAGKSSRQCPRAAFLVERKTFRKCGETSTRGREAFHLIGWLPQDCLSRTNSTICLRSAMALSAIRTLEVHRGSIVFNSSNGDDPRLSTSFKPRSNAASSAPSSGSAFVANNSAVRRALSCGLKFAIADLIS